MLAVEPSAGMRGQRPSDLAPAIIASAEALPLDEDSFEAAMALVTIHHWSDPAAGLRELRRVARGPVVVLTFDIDLLEGFWMLKDYLPETLTDDRVRFPTIDAITTILGDARSSRSLSRPSARTASSRPTTDDRRRTSIPPSVLRSRFGRAYPKASSDGRSRRFLPTSDPARGTHATAIYALARVRRRPAPDRRVARCSISWTSGAPRSSMVTTPGPRLAGDRRRGLRRLPAARPHTPAPSQRCPISAA